MWTLQKRFLVFLFLSCFTTVSYAQTFVLKGILFKKRTSDRVAQVLVTNLRSKVVMVSDELGGFSITAAKGDTLVFTKVDFTEQRLVVTNSNDVAVFMQPVVRLNNVTIKAQTKQQELSEVMSEYRNLGIYNNGKSLPAFTFINSPISGLYQLFGKGPTDARRFQKFAKSELEYNEVFNRYNKDLVIRVTGSTDDEEVKRFMERFTPSYEDIKAWNDYQLIVYIKRSFAFYSKNKKCREVTKALLTI